MRKRPWSLHGGEIEESLGATGRPGRPHRRDRVTAWYRASPLAGGPLPAPRSGPGVRGLTVPPAGTPPATGSIPAPAHRRCLPPERVVLAHADASRRADRRRLIRDARAETFFSNDYHAEVLDAARISPSTLRPRLERRCPRRTTWVIESDSDRLTVVSPGREAGYAAQIVLGTDISQAAHPAAAGGTWVRASHHDNPSAAATLGLKKGHYHHDHALGRPRFSAGPRHDAPGPVPPPRSGLWVCRPAVFTGSSTGHLLRDRRSAGLRPFSRRVLVR